MRTLRWHRFGVATYGDGGARLTGPDVEEVADPDRADVLVIAQYGFVMRRAPAAWARLWDEPAIRRDPSRVVLADCADDEYVPPMPGVLFFRCGAPARLCDAYPSMIPWPWPSPDLGWIRAAAPALHARPYDVTFHGWVRLPVAEQALASVRRAWAAQPGLLHLAAHADFHGYRGLQAGNHVEGVGAPEGLTAETVQRERAFRDGLANAWCSLAPESIPGVLRYRVTEALSAGRIPVVIGDGHRFPFADRIPWGRIAIEIPAAQAAHTGDILKDWLARTSPAERLAREAEARDAYARWLCKDRFAERMADVVREVLAWK